MEDEWKMNGGSMENQRYRQGGIKVVKETPEA
jgi:hypothetical protein